MIRTKQNPLQIFILLLIVFLAMFDKSSSSHSATAKTSTHALTYKIDVLPNMQRQHADVVMANATHGSEAFRDCSDCPEMMRIPGGTFMMGATTEQKYAQEDEKPIHAVEVVPFAIGKFEVTQAEFAAFVNATGYQVNSSACWTQEEGKIALRQDRDWSNPGFEQTGQHPVVCVSLEDANAYAQWLSQKTGKNYRLPTETEWEYAARGGTATARYWGNDANKSCGYANAADRTAAEKTLTKIIHKCEDGFVYTAPAGSFKPNDFGLYDMLGNAAEWTCSKYSSRYDGNEKDCLEGNDKESKRAFRGGSWFDKPRVVRSTNRNGMDISYRDFTFGFRLVQS